ncbi:MAG: flagellar hook protein [Sphingomonadales bacterium 32-68-7]|nr:MAG: flagellar hook protein [Sphingomonadales bacterium 12-68-11]OYX10166.1 MAG: flagellar hook protein [Sphingomonadales bacterium 32-68-7]
MSEIGTSILQTLGGANSTSLVSLADDLAAAQFEPRIARLAAANEALDAKISAASALKNQLTQLATALGERVRAGDLAPTPKIANGAVAQVSRANSRPAGSYSLEVLTLAAAQTLTGPPLADPTTVVGGGTLTLRFGAVAGGAFTADAARTPVPVTIPAGATLEQVAEAINGAGAGVSAYIARAADGARLVLKGAEGANSGFVLEAAGDPGLSALAWEPVAGAPDRLLSTALDAEFEIDGVLMRAPTNKVGEVAPGLSLTLTGTNAGLPTAITFNEAAPAITSTMQDLVAALNEIATALNDATDPQSGELARDDGARALRRQLSALGSAVVMPGATNGAPATLAELGLSINRDGVFSVNLATLERALADDPEGVSAMFTNGLNGVYATVDRIARNASAVGTPGSLASSVNRYTAQKTQIDKESLKAVEMQEAMTARLTKQFAAADAQVAASKSTLSFLQAQIDMWNKSDD